MAMPQRDSWQHAKAVGTCAAMTEDGEAEGQTRLVVRVVE